MFVIYHKDQEVFNFFQSTALLILKTILTTSITMIIIIKIKIKQIFIFYENTVSLIIGNVQRVLKYKMKTPALYPILILSFNMFFKLKNIFVILFKNNNN